MKLSDQRREYRDRPLRRVNLPDSPWDLLQKWLDEATQAGADLPNAMVLATCNEDGQPSTRMVLLKGIQEGALVFYTDYESLKAQDMLSNSKVSLNFFWPLFDRQISILGCAERCSRAQSEAYFRGRPRESQLSALVSEQSAVVTGREELEETVRRQAALYEGKEIPCKESWGGYLVFPTEFVFWQGRLNRLHDRFRYSKGEPWVLERLSP